MLKFKAMTQLLMLPFPNVAIIRFVAETRKLFLETNLHAAFNKPGRYDSKDTSAGFLKPLMEEV